jgi:hypothetical protein
MINEKDVINNFPLCRKCINYISDKNKARCKISNFTGEDSKEAVLFCPWDFDCIEYERARKDP